jgi:hypothetical protein
MSGDCQDGQHDACDGGYDLGPNEHPCGCDCHD